ncbi:MAG TPA: GntR family transcriptional regulator [Methylomirabilota bacterium]|jgi:GntR family transcriptional regulator|nr:GntR family transcriptional regulator [Methylomirabilota bacterium]
MTSPDFQGAEPSPPPEGSRLDSGRIRRRSAVPLYRQLLEILRDEIVSGRLKADQRVATEFELMKRFELSRTTVRQTIAHLRKEGLIAVHRGKGTFVGQGKIEPELSALTGFVEDMQALGLAASARVLGVEEIKAPDPVAESLQLAAGELVTKVTRIRLAEAVPVSFEYSFLPLHLGRRVAEENLEVSPIFSLFEDKYGIALGEALYRIEAARAARVVAEALEIERGAPVLAIERTTYSTAGQPVDFEQMFYRGDRIRYSMRLKRRRPGT